MMNFGLPLSRSFAAVERIEECLHVVALDFLHVESVGAKAHARVLALRRLGHGVERDGVGVVNQDQVIEPEMPGEGARLAPTRLPGGSRRPRGRRCADRKCGAHRC